jgi:disease resistance protein RPM1
MKAIIEVSTETGREDAVLKALVSRIRAVTFEAEDAIDAYMVEAATKKGKRWLQKVFRGIDHASKLREVAKTVQTIKEEVDKMNNYQMLRDALQRRDRAGRRRMERRRPDVEKDNVVGFDEAAATLIDRLTAETEGLQVISIIGMGGLGKTTLANKVFNDPIVSDKFSTLAWIYVSQSYTMKDLLLSILKDVTQVTQVAGDMSNMGEDELAEEISRQLKWKYLIVVDDVWEKKDWDSIKKAFPNEKNGSRILLTTRHKHVAMHADQHSPPHELDFLTHAQSWELLQKKVFDGGDCPEEDLKDVGIRIAVQCDGLPLAVVVIAGMLQTKKAQGLVGDCS